jgi:hypothetical protein
VLLGKTKKISRIDRGNVHTINKLIIVVKKAGLEVNTKKIKQCMHVVIMCDIASYNLYVNQCFREMYRLHL